jgi:choline dehydrogenase-like flavoprotein
MAKTARSSVTAKTHERVFDFVVVGSGGGGGTIAWVLAKAGYSVALLEQGSDIKRDLLGKPNPKRPFNPIAHDEYQYRSGRPSTARRPRGDYNTFRRADDEHAVAKPFKNGWTGTAFGGGSLIWGTWAYRALPIDFRLKTHYAKQKQLRALKEQGYDIADWPIDYADMVPFYNVAEALLAVSGDREALLDSSRRSDWFQAFQNEKYFGVEHFNSGQLPFPCERFPLTPVGRICEMMFDKAVMPDGDKNYAHAPLPSAIVRPGSGEYATRDAIARSLAGWNNPGEFWSQHADQLWSDRKRDACNMCGYCGEFICWGHTQAKSGVRASTLEELMSMKNADIRLNAKAIEVVVDKRTKRGKAVRYIDIADPDHPSVVQTVRGKHIIVSCGAVQTARLLYLSESTDPQCRMGLGNAFDQLGRNATFHLFGLSGKGVLKSKTGNPEQFTNGLLHGEYGHTGNITSMGPYFVKSGETWIKAGTITSTAKKNPLENAIEMVERPDKNLIGKDLIAEMDKYNRTVELRLTGDDLPMPANRVDLDPSYVDEYGIPVARISRSLGAAEWQMFRAVEPKLNALFNGWGAPGSASSIFESARVSPAVQTLIGDHQMGTCRMGESQDASVIDRYCRMWEAPNVFVVDSSFMPTGLGLNPMVSVVANALRVGTWMVQELRNGRPIDG